MVPKIWKNLREKYVAMFLYNIAVFPPYMNINNIYCILIRLTRARINKIKNVSSSLLWHVE